MTDIIVYDVLPPTLAEFADVAGWSDGRATAVDADGDGMLNQSAGGLDPNDGAGYRRRWAGRRL
ncbi:MAG: hypothetical protein R3A10_13000 [Caldilineaceae bacterium]